MVTCNEYNDYNGSGDAEGRVDSVGKQEVGKEQKALSFIFQSFSEVECNRLFWEGESNRANDVWEKGVWGKHVLVQRPMRNMDAALTWLTAIEQHQSCRASPGFSAQDRSRLCGLLAGATFAEGQSPAAPV